MTQPIWYDSSEAGAPTLNNVAGSLLAVLRACLISGFNSKSVTSIAVASGVATATCAAHGFSGTYGKLLLIEGSAEPLLNGNKQPGNVLTNSFTYPAPGEADGTYTGTISAKRAPLGWTEPHTGTNVAMFARSAPEATAMLLRVNDSNSAPATATDTRVVMVESATGVDSFSDAAPTTAQLSGGFFWGRGAASATAKVWAIFGDGLRFFLVSPDSGVAGTYGFGVHFFGDITSTVGPDGYNCVLSGGTAATTANGGNANLATTGSLAAGATASATLARGWDQVTRSVFCRTKIIGHNAAPFGSASLGSTKIDSFLLAYPACIDEETMVRGVLPGLANPLCRTPFAALPQFSVVDTVEGSTKKFVSVLYRAANINGNLMIDVSGPWQ